MSIKPPNLPILTAEDELTLKQFAYLKELRNVTLDYHERKFLLNNSLKMMEEEAKCLETFRKEKEAIEKEKLAHAEELRFIHSDLHQIETIISESETEADHHLTLARSLMSEWEQLADRAKKMRAALGLEELNSLPEEESLRNELNKCSIRDDGFPFPDPTNGFKPLLMLANPHRPNQQPQCPPFLFPSPSPSPQDQCSTASSSSSVGLSPFSNPLQGPSWASNRPSFCQQPPPMKACLTCLQQIHRNAPICPNCKAKSRSRNPKKPKRKTED